MQLGSGRAARATTYTALLIQATRAYATVAELVGEGDLSEHFWLLRYLLAIRLSSKSICALARSDLTSTGLLGTSRSRPTVMLIL